jgi:hypothetical protein
MKKLFSLITIFLCAHIIFALPTLANAKTVTIKWKMTETTDVSGYKIYYDKTLSMNNAEQITNVSTIQDKGSGTFEVQCYDIVLEDNTTYYFTIAAMHNDGTKVFSAPFAATAEAQTSLSAPSQVQDFRTAEYSK